MTENILFTQQTCARCPAAKNKLKELNIEYREVNAATPEGLFEAYEHLVMGTPVLIYNGKKYTADDIMKLGVVNVCKN